MIAYTNIILTSHNPIKLIEQKKNIYRFKFSSLEEAKEVVKILNYRRVDTSLDDTSYCVAIYNAYDFNIDTVGKDFELTICF